MKVLLLAVGTLITLYVTASFAQDSPQWHPPDGAKTHPLARDWLTLDYKSDISKFWKETKR